MKDILKYAVTASLVFGASGFNSAKAVTADELLVSVQQFAGQVVDAFEQVGQALGGHEARITALEAEPKTNIGTINPTRDDDKRALLG